MGVLDQTINGLFYEPLMDTPKKTERHQQIL